MGGGNAQKSATARARKEKEAKAAGKGSQLKANSSALTLKCHVCLSLFICTTTEAKMREHAENKHPKHELYACFPNLKPAA